MRNILACTLASFSLLASAQSPSSILSSLGVTGITSNRTARSSNMIVKTTAEGYIDSSLLPDTAASSFAGKQVYVDVSFTGTNSNGSLSAPYTSLAQVSYTNGLRVILAPGAYASTTLPAGVTNVYFLRDRPFSSYFPVTLSSVTATSSGIFGFSGVSLTTSSFPSGSKLLCYEGGTLSIVSGSTSVVVKDAKTTVSTSVPNFTYLDSATAIRYGSGSYPTVESALDYLFLQTTNGEARVAGTGLVYTVGSTLVALTNGAQGSVLSVGSNGVPNWRSPLVRAGSTNGAIAIWNQASGAFVPTYFPQPGLYGLWYTGLDTEFKSIGFPSSASVGDLLVWTGAGWDSLPNTNAVGYTLTSNGAGKVPTYTSTRETFAGTLLGQLAYWDPVSSLYRPLPVASTPNLLLVSGDASTLPTWKSLQSISNSASVAEASCLVPVPTLNTNSFLFMLVGTNVDIDVSTIVREDPTVARSTELALCTSSGIVTRARASGFGAQDNLQTVYVRFPELDRSSLYYAKYWWTNCLGQLVGKTNTAVLSSYLLEDTSKSSPSQDSSYPGFVWTTNSTDDSLILASYTGTLTRVVIPSTVYGRPVSAIGSYAFANGGGTNVTIVTGGDNITSLAVDAFREHKQLTTVSLPNAYVVGDSAFLACPRLVQVDMPRVVEIGNNAFNSCTSLQYVVFFDAAYVGSSAFNSATALWYVYFPQVTTVLDQAFTGCSDLVEVNLPSVVSIGESAFSGCDSLVNLSAPAAEAVGVGAFYGCTGLASVDFPRASSIADGAFYECASLAEVMLPQAKTFGPEVFYGCTSLTNLTLTQDAPAESFDLFTGIPAGQVSVVVANPASQGWGTTWNGMPVVRLSISASAITLGGETRTNWPSSSSSGDSTVLLNPTNSSFITKIAYGDIQTHRIATESAWVLSAYDGVGETNTIQTAPFYFPNPLTNGAYYSTGAYTVAASGGNTVTFTGPGFTNVATTSFNNPTISVMGDTVESKLEYFGDIANTNLVKSVNVYDLEDTVKSNASLVAGIVSNGIATAGFTKLFNPTNANEWTEIRGDEKWTFTVSSIRVLSVSSDFVDVGNAATLYPNTFIWPFTGNGFVYGSSMTSIEGNAIHPNWLFTQFNGYFDITSPSDVAVWRGTVLGGVATPVQDNARGSAYLTDVPVTNVVVLTLASTGTTAQAVADRVTTGQLAQAIASLPPQSSLLNPTNALSWTEMTETERIVYTVFYTNLLATFSSDFGHIYFPDDNRVRGNTYPHPTTILGLDGSPSSDGYISWFAGRYSYYAGSSTAEWAGDTVLTNVYSGSGGFYGTGTITLTPDWKTNHVVYPILNTDQLPSLIFSNSVSSILVWTNSYGLVTQMARCDKGVWSTNDFSGVHTNDVIALDNKIVQVADYSTNRFNSAYNLASNAYDRFGLDSGYLAVGDIYTTYFGYSAGRESTAAHSTFLGYSAGNSSVSEYSTFVGTLAGSSAYGVDSTYVGYRAGSSSISSNSIFIGVDAGRQARGIAVVHIDAYPTKPSYVNGESTNDAIVLQNGYVNLGRGSAAPGGAKGGELRGVWKYGGKEISSGLTLSDVNARISEHNSTNTAHAELFAQAYASTTGLVPTNRTITIGSQVGSLQSNLVFTSSGGGVDEPTVTNIAQAVASAYVPTNSVEYITTVSNATVALKMNELGGLAIGENALATGESSFSLGDSEASGRFSFGIGGYATGDASVAFQGGLASDLLAFSIGDLAYATNRNSFVWNGRSISYGIYGSHGSRTFNINPDLGTSGFYIGETNLQTYLNQRVEKLNGTATNLSVLTSLNLLGKSITWNDSRQTFDVPLFGGVVGQLFQEQLMLVRNQTGANIANGKVVCSAGAVGDNSAIRKASSSDATCAWGILGMVTQDAGIDHGSDGLICTAGEVNNLPLPTSVYHPSNTLWLTTDGNYTNVEPQGVAVKYQLGIVLRAHATEGRIQFNPQFVPSPSAIGAVSASNATLTGTATINGDVIIGAQTVTNAIKSSHGSIPILDVMTNTLSIVSTNTIYRLSVTSPNSISNDLSQLSFDGNTDKRWELWINYTTTNALSTQWDSRMDFGGSTPDLTVTGQYKFACSTIDGTNIIAKQIYPTVYEWKTSQQNGNFVIIGASTNSSGATAPIIYNEHVFARVYLKGLSGALNKEYTIYSASFVNGTFTNIDLVTKVASSSGYFSSFMDIIPLNAFVFNVNSAGASWYIRKTGTNNTTTLYALTLFRRANELEIKAYNAGWRP